MRTTVLLATIAVAVLTVAPASLASTAQLSVSPGVVTLGSVRVGATTEKAVTLTNTGDESVTLSGFGVRLQRELHGQPEDILARERAAHSASLPHRS
jgi:copper(I)-binding protein